jgi:hypothetical protein
MLISYQASRLYQAFGFWFGDGPGVLDRYGNWLLNLFLCFLQQLQRNMVFGAKQNATCGSMQNSHQQLVLCAISSLFCGRGMRRGRQKKAIKDWSTRSTCTVFASGSPLFFNLLLTRNGLSSLAHLIGWGCSSHLPNVDSTIPADQ